MGRWQASRASVMLWTLFCWESWHSCWYYFDTYHLPKHSCRPNGSCLFQQDDTQWLTADIAQEWLTQSWNSLDLNTIKHLQDVLHRLIHKVSISYLTSAASAWCQRSCEVHVLRSQSYSWGMRGPTQYLAGGFNIKADHCMPLRMTDELF